MYLQTVCFTKCFVNKSQQYGLSPVYTLVCTFKLYFLLNVLLTYHSNMDDPQCVQPYVPWTECFTKWFINKSQQYGRSPVCTPVCTFRLYVLLKVLLTNHSIMDAQQCVHSYVPSDCMFSKCFINKSQQYGRSPLVTPVCTFRFYVLLNDLLTNHSNMDAPQCVHPYVPSDCMLY